MPHDETNTMPHERPSGALLAQGSYLIPWTGLIVSMATRYVHRQGWITSKEFVTIQMPLACLAMYLLGLVLALLALRRTVTSSPARRQVRYALFLNSGCLLAFGVGFVYAVSSGR